MTKHQGGSSGLDELSLFLHISNIGPLILVPFVVLFERNSLITQWSVMSWSNVLLFCMLTVVNGIAYATYNLMSFIGTYVSVTLWDCCVVFVLCLLILCINLSYFLFVSFFFIL